MQFQIYAYQETATPEIKITCFSGTKFILDGGRAWKNISHKITNDVERLHQLSSFLLKKF